MVPLLEADRVSVAVDRVTLLPPTSLQVGAGECVAVLGRNGAGKTTLLRVLAGRVRAGSGAARLRGAPLSERRREVRREIAALIEPPTLYPDLTLHENLALIEAAWSGENARPDGGPRPGGRTRRRNGEAPDLVAGLGAGALERFGLGALRDRFANELSSGQRQLVSLAVVFARPASVLLLDEPEQRLDPERRSLVAETIRAARRRGLGVVLASHDAELVDRVADRRVQVGG